MKRSTRRIWIFVGLAILVLGIASLFVPIPQQEKHGVEIGNLELGIERDVSKPVEPVISAVVIIAGVAIMIVGLKR